MDIGNNAHLTYCTNIHPGETWQEVFESLKKYSLDIKKEIAPNKRFGIGLRLSRKSAETLLNENYLQEFKDWLIENDLYIFTMNGFPYGDFHNVKIKDKVHIPDWTKKERLDYTHDLLKILTILLPDGMEGGISTSPLSYKLWFDQQEELHAVKMKTCYSLIQMVAYMIDIKGRTGKKLHLDLEPEPDGVLENTEEVIDFFNNFLLNEGIQSLKKIIDCSSEEAKIYILDHIQICYDVCHFALAYEEPKDVLLKLQNEGIRIGKIQISAALKCTRSKDVTINEQQKSLKQFDEPTYLHQSVIRQKNGGLKHFSDLKEGINHMDNKYFEEIRTHFHVPVFLSKFQVLESTQDDILKALNLFNDFNYSKHLEVETYTWGVLPEHLRTDIKSSIVRELNWVKQQLK